MNFEKISLLYEGKAKKLFNTNHEDYVIVYYKDDATAFNGIKKASLESKGKYNNEITSVLYERLQDAGIQTHFVKKMSDREQLCKKVNIIPLEVIIRNVIAGSMAKRLGIKEGTVPNNTIFELSYKNDDLGDPLINDDHAIALGVISEDDLKTIKNTALSINQELIKIFRKAGIRLVDFKIEFGKTETGEILLADEISPDTCRLWDFETNKKLDKDRFRRDLGHVMDAYQEILNRIKK